MRRTRLGRTRIGNIEKTDCAGSHSGMLARDEGNPMRCRARVMASLFSLLITACGSGQEEAQRSRDGTLLATLQTQEWIILGAGTSVMVGGRNRPLPWNGGTLSVALHLENRSAEQVYLSSIEFKVVDEGGKEVFDFQVDTTAQSSPVSPLGIVKISAGEQTDLKLMSTLTPIKKIRDGGALKLI
ncbi:MAG: hypothetical protein ACYSX0_09220, partial [Planctomycetota bacterium]